MDARNNLFGKGPRPGLPDRQPPPGGGRGPPMQGGPGGYDRGYGGGYGGASSSGMPPPQQRGPGGYHPSGGHGGAPPPPAPRGGMGGGRPIRLGLAKVEDKTMQSLYIFGNICAVSPNDFPPSRDGTDLYIRLTGSMMSGDFVVTARPTPGFPEGCISLSDPQRTWCGVALTDELVGELYDPFGHGSQAYLGSLDIEVGFASTKKVTDTAYDQDALADLFIKSFGNQIFSPGQRLLLDVRNVPLSILVRTVQLVDLSMEKMAGTDSPTLSDPRARGILTNQASITFFKDARSPIKLKGSSKRPAANAIVSPDFKFEDMGIGGLDMEFSTLFRRAFASRIFPPGLIDKLGIMHVKGILLYGPPGTGKTLIARKIGQMLNAREPKVINGPEVLNKYVGQSEENIRKLFADAEKEYKEKGDESGLHIIIFDELDAVCKQRGSGAGGGTGVGDSVVNQLLSKLDGVEALNNVLLIGMTNRKDMIDDALLRPGRLEVQIEISLPDEAGRQQILKIHTEKMRNNQVMESDVNIAELAAVTKNFSGAEISGLVKSATSFAFNRHIKVGTMAGVADDVANMKVNRADFMHALSEVKPAFGVSEEELETQIVYGIIHYSSTIQQIINDGLIYARNVKELERLRTLSVLVHGPVGAGKTALAAHIAMESQYPFIKLLNPQSLVGFRDEIAKKDYIHKVFSDAYKSPLSILVIDDIESIIEFNPVGPRFSNTILQTLNTLLKAPPPKGHRLLKIATTSRRGILDTLDMTRVFDRQIPVPAVRDMRELATVLQNFSSFDQADLNESINALQSQTQSDVVQVGIKQVLSVAESAQLGGTESAVWFADQLAGIIASNSVMG